MFIIQSILNSFRNFILNPLQSIPYLIAIFVALSFHEAAHGFVAYRNGDDTAKRQGRLSLNVFAHLDLWGTLSLIFFGFGWAKPVPINANNFRNQKKGMIQVSLAGVTMNFILAFLSMGIFALLINLNVFSSIGVTSLKHILYYPLNQDNPFLAFLFFLIQNFVLINIGLGVFNLIPIPPLDGYQLVKELLLGKVPVNFFWQYERYGRIILILLVFTGVLGNWIIGPLRNGIITLFSWFWGLFL